MQIVLIVAVADNGVIGADGAIPWRLKTDQQRLKAMTIGQAGGDGPQDLPLAAPAVARTHQHRHDARRGLSRPRRGGDDVARTGPAVATGDALRRFVTEIAVIGGAEIYAQWMDIADRLEITEVHARRQRAIHVLPRSSRRSGKRSRGAENPSGPDDSADFFLCDISPGERAH